MRMFTKFKAAIFSALFFLLFCVNSFAQCTLSVDFESDWDGIGYAARTVTDQWGDWSVSGVVVTTDANDRMHSGVKSIRLRGNTGDNCHFQMNFDKQNGIGEISFYYASYSTHSGGTIVVYYSTNAGTTWIEAGSVAPPAWGGEMIPANFPINVQGNVRIKVVREGSLASGTTVNVDDFCLSDFNPSGYVAAPTFNPLGGSYTEPIQVTISSATAGATIRYTLDGTDPTETSTQYATPIPVSQQTTMKAKAWKEGMTESPISTANYIFPQGISTLEALRALAPEYNGGTNAGTTVYTYTGQAVVTNKQNFNHVKYIQDETAAIMIFDPGTGNLQANIEIGDKITNITGTLTNYFGMIELIPKEECVVSGYLQQVCTTEIEAKDLDFNHNSEIQAKVVTIKGVLYTQTGIFDKGAYYDLKENTIVYDSVVYIENFDADYIGDNIPTILVNINGVINFKGGATFATRNRIVPLDKNNNIIKTDCSEGVFDCNKAAIKLAPNPANSFVNIITDSPIKLEIYGLLGNRVATEQLYEGSNTISIAHYPPGMYIMKLIDRNTGQISVQKLIIQ